MNILMRAEKRRALLFLTAATFLVVTSPAEILGQRTDADQMPPEHRIFEGRTYDPDIPTPSAHFGYGLGEYHATYASLVPYLERLAESSDRMMLGTYGESWERRKIYRAVFSSPENLARLDEIRSNLASLADPRELGSAGDAEAILEDTPAVVFLDFGVDGNETAATEAAVQVAYQLTAGTDAETERILQELVVVVLPAVNPDSNQRMVAWYNAFQVGLSGTADPQAVEHRAPWGMNTNNNHYQIDLNRESVWNIQPETQALARLFRLWNPQVLVDFHGQHAQFTGPWYSEPLHEQITDRQREWFRIFGQEMAEAFADYGYRYSPWEFGQFDPGYWDTFGNFNGAVAWCTEATGGGSRGLRFQEKDGPEYTLEDAIIENMVAADLTLRVAAGNREALLRDFLAYKRSAVEAGNEGSVSAYVLSGQGDDRRIQSVVNTLLRNGIEVRRTTEEVRLSNARPHFSPEEGLSGRGRAVELPSGSYVLSLSQPQSRMLRVLMEPEATLSQDFLDQIQEKVQRGSYQRLFYDITGWSMPLTYHVEAYEVEEISGVDTELVTEMVEVEGEVVNPGAEYGFLVPYDSNAALNVLARFRKEGLLFRVALEPFSVDGRQFGSGTLAVFGGENGNRDLGSIVADVAEESGATIVGVDGPLSEEGRHVGSNGNLVPVPGGRIAVTMDRPVDPNSFGTIWYMFERIYPIEFTAIRFEELTEADLDEYGIIILPDGDYADVRSALAVDVAAHLKAWLQRGGRLVALRNASAWVAREDFGITDARVKDPGEEVGAFVPQLPGTIMRARVAAPEHPLAFGFQDEIPVMVWSRMAFEGPAGMEAPIRIAEADRARVSGFAFPESLEYVGGTPYVVRERRGEGTVVLFLDDPNFRSFWEGLTRMFFNAVFFSGVS